MNKILYEASYIGSPKIFLMNALGILLGIFVMSGAVHRLEKRQDKETEEVGFLRKMSGIQEHFILDFLGIVLLVEIILMILSYNKVILGYKKGKYFEVEGIVADYLDNSHGYTFRVNGKNFKVSESNFVDWGYSYWALDKNVITGDGQHLRIRYIPPDTIVYIEEIADE